MVRQKVGVACDRCRMRKIKCDAKKPTCSPCISRNDTSCIYSGRGNYRSSQRKRQALFPRELYRVPEPASSTDNASCAQQLVTQRAMAPPIARQSVTSSSSPSGSNRVNFQAISIPSGTSTPKTPTQNAPSQDIDAMTGVGRDQSSTTEFFGGSSAISFTTQINSAIDAYLGQSSGSGTRDASAIDGARRHDQTAMDASEIQPDDPIDPLALSLPPKSFADGIVQDYFDLVWNVLPVHDWPTFKHDYAAVWSGSVTKTPTRPLYCMINMMLALGSQFAQAVQPAERKRMGQTFWERALALFDPRLQKNASLEGIQCLLLMGLFLQSTNHSHQCWMVVGSAVRMAQTLGLHLSRAINFDENPPLDIELTRRVWHGCVFMDRVMSMTFGRPSMIANWLYKAVPLPAMIDDDALLQDTVSDLAASNYGSGNGIGGTVPIIAFFIKSVELYSIVNDSLLELYVQPRDEHSEHAAQHLSTVLQLDDKLGRWAQSIPLGLRYSNEPNDNFVIQRQRINLRARYLHARILVLRPFLAEACLKQVRADVGDHGQGSSNPLADRLISHGIAGNCSNICSESAHEIITIIYENLDLKTVTGPVPAWWFAVLFVYTAATVLLAERFRHFKSSGEQSDENARISSRTTRSQALERAWDQAIKILEAYSKVGGSARRCVAALEILQAKIQAHQHHQPDRSHTNSELSGRLQSSTSISTLSSVPAVSMPISLPAYEDYGQIVDLGDIDFDIDDMLWLNTSVADIFS